MKECERHASISTSRDGRSRLLTTSFKVGGAAEEDNGEVEDVFAWMTLVPGPGGQVSKRTENAQLRRCTLDGERACLFRDKLKPNLWGH